MKPNFPDLTLPPLAIVDDCDDDVFLLRHGLRTGGVTNPLVTFNSPKDALAYLCCAARTSPRPALLFTDIKMPVADGFDFIGRIRAEREWDDMRIVVVTSSNQPADLQRALSLRVDGYLIKFPPPYILTEFVTHGPWFAVPRRVEALTNALSA